MTTLRPCVQKQRSDGFYPVYIRVIHNRQSAFIKTDKLVDRKGVSKTREIRDNVVLNYCTNLICEYNKLLNMQNTSAWSIQEVITFLTKDQADASFSEYAKLHINRMINTGHERTAKNYQLAVAHLERFIGSNQIMFSYLTSSVLKRWIKDLEQKRRAKEMYPVCVRQIFKAALVELNDEERGIIRIKFNPWLKVQIPSSEKSMQIAISAEACREFFNRPLPQTKNEDPETSVYDSLVKDMPLPIVNVRENLDLVPASLELARAEIDMATKIAREGILKSLLEEHLDKYDYVLIDCPPSLGIVTTNALVASDELFIPLTAEALPLKGLTMLDDVVNEVRKRVNPKLEIGAVFFTRFNNRKLNKEVVTMVANRYGDKVLNTKIRENISLAEMPLSGQSIFEYDPKSNGATDYMALVNELIAKNRNR